MNRRRRRRRPSSLGLNLESSVSADDEETQDTNFWGSIKRKLSGARKVSDSLTPRNCFNNLSEETDQTELEEKFDCKVF